MRENRKQGKYSESFDRKRDANLRANHDMTLEEYNLQLFQQGGVCAICKQPETLIDGYTGKPRNLCVDHHHGLKINRELLCLNCNLIVGWIEQDRDRVQKVMKYLKRHDN